MVTTLESTITIHSAAVGAAVQSVKLTEKQEVNTMLVALLVVLVPSAEAADFPWLGSYVARWLGHFGLFRQ